MNVKNQIKDYFVIFIGCILLGIAIQKFYLPHNLVTGGFSGISIILTRMLENRFDIHISVAVLNLCLNVPLFIVTFFLLGYRMVIRSFFATISLTVTLSVLAMLPTFDTDLILASLFGGVFSGLGLGLVISKFSTTGGTDLVSMIIKKYLKHFDVSRLLFMIDSTIIICGLFAFGIENCMYAIISVYVCAKVIDGVLEGLNFAKIAYIITEKHNEISNEIFDKIDRGVTGLESIGMYTKNKKVTLMAVISIKEIPALKQLVKEIDPKAFIIFSDAREVFGEGFGKIENI